MGLGLGAPLYGISVELWCEAPRGNLLLKPVSWAWPSRRGFGKNGRERLKNAGLQEAAGHLVLA